MTITKVTGLPKCITWGESLIDIDSITATVKMGSNESASNCIAYIGYTFDFCIDNDGVNNPVDNIVSQRYQIRDGQGRWSLPKASYELNIDPDLEGKRISIGKGATKTITFYPRPNGNGANGHIIDPFAIPELTDIWSGTDTWGDRVSRHIAFENRINAISVWVLITDPEGPTTLFAVKRNIATFVTNRLPPVINSISVSDKSGIYDHFGAYMVGKGEISISCSFTLDPADPTLSAGQQIWIHDIHPPRKSYSYNYETSIGVSQLNVDIPMVENASDGWRIEIMVWDDSQHYSGSTESDPIDIVVLPYFDPTIAELTGRDILERYSVVQREGELQPVEEHDELGRTLWFNADVNAYQTPTGYPDNQWALNLYLGNETIPVVRWDSEDIELPLHYENSHVPFGDRDFLPGQKYIFTLKLTDYFHQGDNAIVIGNIVVEAGTGYFNIEKNGVAIGMLSTATSDEKKTESAYPIFPYGGIVGLNFYPENEQKVGTYIDGKPLYSRTFVATNISHTSSATNTTINTIADLENVAWLIGVKKQLDGYFNPLPYYYNSSQYGYCYVNPSGSVIFWHSDGSGSAKCDVLVTVWYTKTTDTVVSE